MTAASVIWRRCVAFTCAIHIRLPIVKATFVMRYTLFVVWPRPVQPPITRHPGKASSRPNHQVPHMGDPRRHANVISVAMTGSRSRLIRDLRAFWPTLQVACSLPIATAGMACFATPSSVRGAGIHRDRPQSSPLLPFPFAAHAASARSRENRPNSQR